jgi:hypothetical protein
MIIKIKINEHFGEPTALVLNGGMGVQNRGPAQSWQVFDNQAYKSNNQRLGAGSDVVTDVEQRKASNAHW